mmetsp:Transcript_20841/g.52787  ORF Transcript_20841/g.52787 Transcript_20841/m.52787 type:complete len:99 (+) Transcript_20841:3-299(+)
MVCSLYAEHYAAWGGGVPDLMLWRTGNEQPSLRFVEVKGPGDSLSNGQRAWLDKLLAAGADAFVCHVDAQDDDSMAVTEDGAAQPSAPAFNFIAAATD